MVYPSVQSPHKMPVLDGPHMKASNTSFEEVCGRRISVPVSVPS